jgi:hypothetical protein
MRHNLAANFYVTSLHFNASGPTGHKFPDSIRIIYFRLGLKPCLHQFHPWLVIISEAFVSVLILMLSRIRWSICSLTVVTTYYSRWMIIKHTSTLLSIFQPNCKISSGSCRCRHIKLPFFSKFHSLWAQKVHHRSLFFSDELYQWSSHGNLVTVLPLL